MSETVDTTCGKHAPHLSPAGCNPWSFAGLAWLNQYTASWRSCCIIVTGFRQAHICEPDSLQDSASYHSCRLLELLQSRLFFFTVAFGRMTILLLGYTRWPNARLCICQRLLSPQTWVFLKSDTPPPWGWLWKRPSDPYFSKWNLFRMSLMADAQTLILPSCHHHGLFCLFLELSSLLLPFLIPTPFFR